ncbi:tryptophan 7-halogenase [Gilvimarinus sp. SDUM040013]|uniref:Tryptophan halogenase family protein n=1 Tax=Gilvimarinus gilvus TaxID=3058038 RepID=A0ABU4RUT7_9GAMM|nr:tryptophan halogenase family protein [Gilvimarinus sp. SDUM040013]MDO3388491.1 tryptophan 7-halogenase [Gilvimarinus sp. SDUM040013]MDX6848637.1 tryptophan halogenase family protein [Gilvimarinus sp. SDUM040013]
MNQHLKHIVVLGGGSAGWLTASIIAAEHCCNSPNGVKITLIESPDVATVGVGEGTWPTMRQTLSRIGISEKIFFRECDASFKQGSQFRGWVNGSDTDAYYHPFVLPEGYFEANLHNYWRRQFRGASYADTFTSQTHLCKKGLAPKQMATPDYAAVVNYGYHLNVGKFGQLLQRHATSKLGVNHILDHVTGVNSADNGDIHSLSTHNHGELKADLFIDCSGSASLLLGKHYNIGWRDCRPYLFNDRAVATQVPYSDPEAPIASTTISTAQNEGWIWDIALPTRRGVGFVYASEFTSDDQAEQNLREHIERDTSENIFSSLNIKAIKFDPGHRHQFWHRNCIGVGMSAGFIEPLEASALVMVELAAEMIRDDLPTNREMMDYTARRFNEKFLYRWDRVIEFLKLHYVLSQRKGEYWNAHRNPESIPESLSEKLMLWKHRPPSELDFDRKGEVFPSASYQYVLYGMGFNTEPRSTYKVSDNDATIEKFIAMNRQKLTKYINALPSNRAMIKHLLR